MNPADEQSTTQNTDTSLAALNEAIAEAEANPEELESSTTSSESAVDINSLPSDAEVVAAEAKAAEAGTAPVAPTPAPAAEPKPEVAGFVDGDLANDPAAAPAPVTKPTDMNADPIAGFDADNTQASASSAVAADSKEDDAKKKKVAAKSVNIDFDAILHNPIAIIGIVVGAMIAIFVIVLVVALG